MYSTFKPHRPCHPAYRARGGKTHESSRQRVAKATRSRGNPFLPAYAGQKFLPLALLRLADFRGAPQWALAKTGALRQPRLRCFVHWTRLARLPPGDKIWRRTAHSPQSGSHTLSAKFPCRCPVHPHMSAGRDFFDSLTRIFAPGMPAPGGGEIFLRKGLANPPPLRYNTTCKAHMPL